LILTGAQRLHDLAKGQRVAVDLVAATVTVTAARTAGLSVRTKLQRHRRPLQRGGLVARRAERYQRPPGARQLAAAALHALRQAHLLARLVGVKLVALTCDARLHPPAGGEHLSAHLVRLGRAQAAVRPLHAL